MFRKSKHKHDYKPIRFCYVDNNNDRYHPSYIYDVQCMICGRKAIIPRKFKERQNLYTPFEHKHNLKKQD